MWHQRLRQTRRLQTSSGLDSATVHRNYFATLARGSSSWKVPGGLSGFLVPIVVRSVLITPMLLPVGWQRSSPSNAFRNTRLQKPIDSSLSINIHLHPSTSPSKIRYCHPFPEVPPSPVVFCLLPSGPSLPDSRFFRVISAAEPRVGARKAVKGSDDCALLLKL